MYPPEGAGTQRRFIISFEQINMSLVRVDSTRGDIEAKGWDIGAAGGNLNRIGSRHQLVCYGGKQLKACDRRNSQERHSHVLETIWEHKCYEVIL